MIALKLILWILVCYSLTQILVDMKISDGLRHATMKRSWKTVVDINGKLSEIEELVPSWLTKLLSCYACTGFWIGILFSILLWSPNLAVFQENILPDAVYSWILFVFFDGLLSSVTVWFLHLIENKIG